MCVCVLALQLVYTPLGRGGLNGWGGAMNIDYGVINTLRGRGERKGRKEEERGKDSERERERERERLI